jgi:hypothetical protein
MTNLSGSLIGLSMLTGSNSFLSFASTGTTTSADTRAVRQAKALFTTPATTAPWKLAASTTPVSTQVSLIQSMKTIIDKPATGKDAVPNDVQTAFTTYKALDRLRLLAETASATTTSSSQRTVLQTAFAKGLDDLQGYLSTAPSDLLTLAFGQPARRAESVAMISPATLTATTVAGNGVATARDAPLAGLTGTEQFRVNLSKSSGSDSLVVDLSGTPQPPTLDSVATAINAAIAAVPARDTSGNVVLDTNGVPEQRWSGVSFTPTKSNGKWGLTLNTNGLEKVSLDQVSARDAVMVATGVTGLDFPTATRVMRIGDAAGAMTRQTVGSIAGVDSVATQQAALAAEAKPASTTSTSTTTATTPANVLAPTTASGIATDAAGFSYMVGTSSGDLGSNLSDGNDDLMLVKLDSEGKQVWQRSLGATGSAQGAAVTIAPDGGIVVAGTVTGNLDGTNSDGDMMVAKFDANGDEKFTKLVRATGADSASAVAVGADGSIFVGGRASTGDGDAFVARFSATTGAMPGTQVNATGDGRDGFVARIDSSLSTSQVTYLATAGDDQVDSVSFLNGDIYAGGRTTGNLGGQRSGTVDGFVTRLDAASGAVENTSQFGQPSLRTEPVRGAGRARAAPRRDHLHRFGKAGGADQPARGR